MGDLTLFIYALACPVIAGTQGWLSVFMEGTIRIHGGKCNPEQEAIGASAH